MRSSLFFQSNPRFIVDEKLEGIPNDPILYGDMPSKIFTLNNPKKTTVIRTSNVARDVKINQETGKTEVAQLNEEFRNYLIASPKKIHFYVNLLERDMDDLGKTALVEKLENDLLAGSSIAVITLVKKKSSNFSRLSKGGICRPFRCPSIQANLFYHFI